MRDGIYKITFTASSGDMGDGIVVVKGGSINGADHGFLYLGTIEHAEGRFRARLTVRRWDPNAYSVFGPVDEFVLEFSGNDVAEDKFEAQGEVPGRPFDRLGVRGRFLSDAA